MKSVFSRQHKPISSNASADIQNSNDPFFKPNPSFAAKEEEKPAASAAAKEEEQPAASAAAAEEEMPAASAAAAAPAEEEKSAK
jgi:hypothetical protein